MYGECGNGWLWGGGRGCSVRSQSRLQYHYNRFNTIPNLKEFSIFRLEPLKSIKYLRNVVKITHADQKFRKEGLTL